MNALGSIYYTKNLNLQSALWRNNAGAGDNTSLSAHSKSRYGDMDIVDIRSSSIALSSNQKNMDTLRVSGVGDALKVAIEEFKHFTHKEGIKPKDIEPFVEKIRYYEHVGSMIERPAEAKELDDFQWGVLVATGMSLGIKADKYFTEKVVQLDGRDLDDFAHEFYIKDKLSAYLPETVESYTSKEDFWNAKFIVEDGKVIRNEDFKGITDTNYFGGEKMKLHSSYYKKLTESQPSSLFLVEEGLRENNFNKFYYGRFYINATGDVFNGTKLSTYLERMHQMNFLYEINCGADRTGSIILNSTLNYFVQSQSYFKAGGNEHPLSGATAVQSFL